MMMTLKTMLTAGLALHLAAFALAAEMIDPRGPVDYPGMKAAADRQGVRARAAWRVRLESPMYITRSATSAGSRRRGRRRWIWLGGEQDAAVGTFRKEITLAETPRQVNAWLTADVKYRLYINGRLVSRGPVDMGRDYAGGSTRRWFYDYRDLTPYFTQARTSSPPRCSTIGRSGRPYRGGIPGSSSRPK